MSPLWRRLRVPVLQRRIGAPRELPRLLTAQEAADLFGVPASWMLAQARANRVPHQRLGKYVRFDPAALAQWLRDTQCGGDGNRRAQWTSPGFEDT